MTAAEIRTEVLTEVRAELDAHLASAKASMRRLGSMGDTDTVYALAMIASGLDVAARAVAVVAARGAVPVEQPDPCDPAPDDDAPVWARIAEDRYERMAGGVRWGLDHCDATEIGPGDHWPGWYLYGPGEHAGGTWVGRTVSVARVVADVAIVQAECERA